MKTFRAGVKEEHMLESLESYEDFIENAYFERFGTLTLNVEASSTTQEYEKWIDQKFKDTLCPSCLQELFKRDESIQKENSMKRSDAAIEKYYPTTAKSPAQQESNNTIGSASLAATMDLHGVTPYFAWNRPLIQPEKLVQTVAWGTSPFANVPRHQH